MMTITGNNWPDQIIGKSENETIDGMGGNDRIDGAGGVDTVLFFDNRSEFTVTTLSGVTHVQGPSNTTSSYSNSESVLINVESIQFLDATLSLAGTASPVIFGDSWSGQITGTAENDIIDGVGGSDQIDGGAGTDLALFFGKSSDFTVSTLAGVTHVKALGSASALYANSETVLVNVENIQFSDITLFPSTASGPVIFGHNWSDQIICTTGDDTIDGMGGADRIDGDAGTDTVLFFGSSSDFAVSTLSGVTHVKPLSSSAIAQYGNAESVLLNVENIQFSDVKVAISANGNPASQTGTAGDDSLLGGGGGSIDGGAGRDTVVYAGNHAVITHNGDGRFTVDGDTLINIERLQFADSKLALDMGMTQAGGEAALMLGACLGSSGLSDKAAAGFALSYLDAGYNLGSLSELLVSSGITAQLAGGADNNHFVYWLCKNVLGTPPSAELQSFCLNLLGSGAFTQASFLSTVASLDLNQQHINLVGLQQTGIEYV